MEFLRRRGEGRPARRYYFVGRLTNDYAGATFAKTKKTLSLNHKEPLPEARTRHIIHGHLDEGALLSPFPRGLPAAICHGPPSHPLCPPCPPAFPVPPRGFSRVYLPPNAPPFFRTPKTTARDEFCRREQSRGAMQWPLQFWHKNS